MTYAIYITENFEKEIFTLSEKDKKIKKLFQKLKNNPYVDDQIRYKFF